MNLKNIVRSMALFSAMALTACGPEFEEPLADGANAPEQAVSTEEEGQVRAAAICTYAVFANSLTIVRDQSTSLGNYEGQLELRGRFTAAGTTAPEYPSSSSYLSGSEGQTLSMGQLITQITVVDSASWQLNAELWEIENGMQGGTDYGQALTNMSFSCSSYSSITASVPVTISADNYKEKSGTVNVNFVAYRVN
jgi:hypothetical protein